MSAFERNPSPSVRNGLGLLVAIWKAWLWYLGIDSCPSELFSHILKKFAGAEKGPCDLVFCIFHPQWPGPEFVRWVKSFCPHNISSVVECLSMY